MVRTLDTCSKGPGFVTTFRPVIKCEEKISQLSVIPGKKAKGIIRCGHIERKDYSVGPLCLAHKPTPCKDSKRMCLSIINYQLSTIFAMIVTTYHDKPLKFSGTTACHDKW